MCFVVLCCFMLCNLCCVMLFCVVWCFDEILSRGKMNLFLYMPKLILKQLLAYTTLVNAKELADFKQCQNIDKINI